MNLQRIATQAGRMAMRDWRAGELRLLLASLVVAVASVTSVGFLVDRIRSALERDAAQLIGGDLVINADQPVPAEFTAEAVRRGLQSTDTVSFPSMAIAGELTQLGALKAVQPGYPLRGAMRVAQAPAGADVATRDVPDPGTVWVDPQLLSLLRVGVGDEITLGERKFRIARLIVIEPDRGMNFVNIAPRVMLRLEDVASTGLVTAGSRVTYRTLMAGDRKSIADYGSWLQPRLGRGQRIESVASGPNGGRPEMRQTLDRAGRFLSLVALLSALIAAVAVALSARRFTLRHLESTAVMRCLGSTQDEVSLMFFVEFMMLALVGAAIGCAIGYGAHLVLLAWLGDLVASDLPQPGPMPALQGFAAGVLLLLGFALPPLAQLRHVPPARVLRRDAGAPQGRALFGYLIGATTFAALLLWFAGDLKLGALTAGGFLAGFAVFGLVAWFGVRLLAPLRRIPSAGVTWRFALAGVARRQGATVAQVVALGIGLMALLLLMVTRNDLVDGWRKAAPADAPNRFVLNIQPDQVDAIARRIAAIGVPQAELYPMIRGRLVTINGRPVKVEDYADERAQRLVDREFNLSTMTVLPGHNRITSGAWFGPQASEVSMEEGIAKTLDLKLGDDLVWDIAGQKAATRITSLRALEWDSMKPNFFAIVAPASVKDMPRSHITSFHLPGGRESAINDLVRDFPNLTVVDMGAIIRQVQAVLDQVIAAVQFLFLFTLASGCLVLYAALASSRDERVREAGLMRALGATRRQLARAQWIELAFVGGIAGLLASAGASVIGWMLAKFIFNFAWKGDPAIAAYGLAGGLACALVGGWMGLRGVLRQPPLQTLREA